MTTIAQKLFKRALDEKLVELRKRAFIPMGTSAEKTGAQAPGPGGAQVDPMAGGGAPMDPSMGGAPMDPAMGGAPMDPAMGGMPPPPMDPSMGGMPPMDPAMGGMPPPMDMGMPPPAEGGGDGLTKEDADTVNTITQRTLDIVRQTLEMVGKAKKPEGGEAAAPSTITPPPESLPGPVTGQPGFDPAMFGATKTASVLSFILRKNAAADHSIGEYRAKLKAQEANKADAEKNRMNRLSKDLPPAMSVNHPSYVAPLDKKWLAGRKAEAKSVLKKNPKLDYPNS